MLSVILPYKARTFLIHGLSALCTRLLGLLGFLLYTIRPVPVKRSASAPILSPAVWVVCPGAPVLASQHRKGMLCNPGKMPQKKAGWTRPGKESMAVRTPDPRREAGKRSGKNLVFPRRPGAASPSGMIVILALCQNNTPPALQEGPGGLRREEAWGGLRRSEGSGLG